MCGEALDVRGDVCLARTVVERRHSSDYIDFHLPLGRNLGKEILLMLTISDLIAVISLCATFYSLGYVRGKHDSKAQK